MNKRLKYMGYSIVTQEVPNEVSLAINISGCPYKCRGCHSEYLWAYEGEYISDDIDRLLNEYGDLITCVCFMGGDQNENELIKLIQKVKKRGLKTCLYTGSELEDVANEIVSSLDYIKTGRYIEKYGGLDSEETNQRMYDLKKHKEIFFGKKTNRE